MSGRTGKVTATVVGISALAVIVLASTGFWQEIQVQYHLSRLRNDSEYLRGYTQNLVPEDEELLRDNYRKLAPSLTYDPETGMASLDYTNGRRLHAEFGDVVTNLRRKRYITFIDPIVREGQRDLSFAANTAGTFIIPIPFKYLVRVEWDMSIQSLDVNGKFNCIVMYDRKKSHYLTDWVHWGSSQRGTAPKWVKMHPDKKLRRNADWWFDKTRDVGMIVEFKMPGGDLAGTTEEITSTATMSCTYDAKLDPAVNTFVSKNPITDSGYIGFKWHRVKFKVKNLKISGILDKQLAVAQLKKLMGIKSTSPK